MSYLSFISAMGLTAIFMTYVNTVGSKHVQRLYRWIKSKLSVYYTLLLNKKKHRYPDFFKLKIIGIYSSVNVYYKD